jgi:hypothetical protein
LLFEIFVSIEGHFAKKFTNSKRRGQKRLKIIFLKSILFVPTYDTHSTDLKTSPQANLDRF